MTAVFYSSDHPIHCPGCDTELTAHLQLPIEQRPKPEQGASVCGYCGHVGIYTERLGRLALRTPTNEELVDMFDRSPALLDAAMRAKVKFGE